MKQPVNEYRSFHPAVFSAFRFGVFFLSRLFWRIEFVNTEHIPAEDGRGLVIASNHQTYLDPFWICVPVKRKLRFLAWDKAFDWLFIGWLIRGLGAFPVDIDLRGAIGSTKESLRVLGEGSTLVVFPEGSRAFSDGKLLKFRPGAVRLASEAGAPLLPVTICGGNRIWPRGKSFPRPGKLKIIYHPVMEFSPSSGSSGEWVEEAVAELERVISSAL